MSEHADNSDIEHVEHNAERGVRFPENMNRRHNAHNRRFSDFESCPRFDKHELTEEQITEIAKRAVILAKNDFYIDVGKSVTTKGLAIIGLGIFVLWQYLTKVGIFK